MERDTLFRKSIAVAVEINIVPLARGRRRRPSALNLRAAA
jgi:hypothetical protein